MNYKLKNKDKIEVEVWDLRRMIEAIKETHVVFPAEIEVKYPAAFAPDEEWEDVTDHCRIACASGSRDTKTGFTNNPYRQPEFFDACDPGPNFKIEGGRIFRLKS